MWIRKSKYNYLCDRLNKLTDVVVALEKRSTFFLPPSKTGTYGYPMYAGYTLTDDNIHVSTKEVLEIILCELGVKIERTKTPTKKIKLVDL